jgi:branched-chain amino acid aminotransferase
MLYINNNEKILSTGDFNINSNNRAYRYGDGLFESIRIRNGYPINLNNHIKRIFEGAKILKIRIPHYYTVEFFEIRIRELCSKSNIYGGGYCRLSIERAASGKFKPEINDAEFTIEVFPLDNNEFVLNTKGLEVDIYSDIVKYKNILSNFKTKNCLISVLASIRAQEKQLDDLLLCNENGVILESSNSNLFIVSNGILYTPRLEDGCLAGTMRMQIINIAIRHNLRVYESTIFPKNLLIADEVFLTNAISGITWIGSYKTKRYFNTISIKLYKYLNDFWSY